MPETGQGLEATPLLPDHDTRTGLFAPGVPHTITVIKSRDKLYMHVTNDEQARLFHWDTDSRPAITEGRVGLRHMYTRSALYRNFRISVLSDAMNEK